MTTKKRSWQAPRSASGIRELRQKIEDFLDARIDAESDVLEQQYLADARASSASDHEAVQSFLTSYHSHGAKKARAVAAAKRGDTRPMKELVDSDFAPFIQPVRPGARGHHFAKEEFRPPKDDLGTQLKRRTLLDDPKGVKEIDRRLRVHAAVLDARRIREFRKLHLDGKSNGPIAGDLTAEGIAADRWGLGDGEVRKKRRAVGTR